MEATWWNWVSVDPDRSSSNGSSTEERRSVRSKIVPMRESSNSFCHRSFTCGAFICRGPVFQPHQLARQYGVEEFKSLTEPPYHAKAGRYVGFLRACCPLKQAVPAKSHEKKSDRSFGIGQEERHRAPMRNTCACQRRSRSHVDSLHAGRLFDEAALFCSIHRARGPSYRHHGRACFTAPPDGHG